MPFPEDLLQLANDLAANKPTEPNQASLRRAVSTAYYALFHLLIDEAVGKWAVERHRSELARTLVHSEMKKQCADVVKRFRSEAKLPDELFTIAQSFILLQENRHLADYDNSKQWSRDDVSGVLTLATDAFSSWSAIEAQDDAQDFLLQLLFPKLPRQ